MLLTEKAVTSGGGTPSLDGESAKPADGRALVEEARKTGGNPRTEAAPQVGGLTPDQQKLVMASVDADIANPARLNQGMYATCTVTSMQFMLCSSNPTEYRQLMDDLVTTGRAQLSNGDYIYLDPKDLNPDALAATPPFEQRSVSERVLQAALMRYALGQGTTYDSVNDMAVGSRDGSTTQYRGLYKDQYEKVLQAVFDCGFERKDASGPPASDRDIQDIVGELAKGRGGVLVEVRWADGGPHALHAITVTKIQGDTVYFYNPHGADPAKGVNGSMQSMSLAEFKERLSCSMIEGGGRNDITKLPPNMNYEVRRLENGKEVVLVHDSPVATKDAQPAPGAKPKEDAPPREVELNLQRKPETEKVDQGPAEPVQNLPKKERTFGRRKRDDLDTEEIDIN